MNFQNPQCIFGYFVLFLMRQLTICMEKWLDVNNITHKIQKWKTIFQIDMYIALGIREIKLDCVFFSSSGKIKESLVTNIWLKNDENGNFIYYLFFERYSTHV